MEFNQIYIPFIIIIIALVIYLAIIVFKIKNQKARNKELHRILDDFNAETKENARESIRIICLAVIQDQCELSEGCIRIRNLLEYFPETKFKTEYSVIFKFYEEIKSFATHDNYKNLKLSEQFKQDKQRSKIEGKHEDDFKQSIANLRDYLKTS